MTTLNIKEAQANLSDIIHRMAPGDEIVIVENEQPVARLVPPIQGANRPVRQLGTLRGTIVHTAADFDAPLNDFLEYMP